MRAIRGVRRDRETTFRLAGRHRFAVHAATGADEIDWTVDREERDEQTGTLVLRPAFARARGREASFDLPKLPGRETTYHVRTGRAEVRETHSVRVLPPDRSSSFLYSTPDHAPVRVHLVAPSTLSPATRLVAVMHGLLRNAENYIESWRDWATCNDRVVFCPCFDRAGWPGSRAYNLGNVFAGGSGGLRPEPEWSFSVLEALHLHLQHGLGLADDGFDLWGHSAGAQFVHRYLLFKPHAPVRRAIAAGAGWYTEPDLEVRFPYGVRHRLLDFRRTQLLRYTERSVTLMRGTDDRLRDHTLRSTRAADAQGANRFERAAHMHRCVLALNPRSPWRLVGVPGVGHDEQRMAPAAQAA